LSNIEISLERSDNKIDFVYLLHSIHPFGQVHSDSGSSSESLWFELFFFQEGSNLFDEIVINLFVIEFNKIIQERHFGHLLDTSAPPIGYFLARTEWIVDFFLWDLLEEETEYITDGYQSLWRVKHLLQSSNMTLLNTLNSSLCRFLNRNSLSKLSLTLVLNALSFVSDNLSISLFSRYFDSDFISLSFLC
jgi:hypothetical protein